MEPLLPTPPRADPNRNLKIAGAVVLGCVALCGVLGTCVFILSLLWPLLARGQ